MKRVVVREDNNSGEALCFDHIILELFHMNLGRERERERAGESESGTVQWARQ